MIQAASPGRGWSHSFEFPHASGKGFDLLFECLDPRDLLAEPRGDVVVVRGFLLVRGGVAGGIEHVGGRCRCGGERTVLVAGHRDFLGVWVCSAAGEGAGAGFAVSVGAALSCWASAGVATR